MAAAQLPEIQEIISTTSGAEPMEPRWLGILFGPYRVSGVSIIEPRIAKAADLKTVVTSNRKYSPMYSQISSKAGVFELSQVQ